LDEWQAHVAIKKKDLGKEKIDKNGISPRTNILPIERNAK
jgi:hypothetical protein